MSKVTWWPLTEHNADLVAGRLDAVVGELGLLDIPEFAEGKDYEIKALLKDEEISVRALASVF